MNLNIKMNLDNSAFEDNHHEVRHILGKLCNEIEDLQGFKIPNGGAGGKLLDYNGNSVGSWSIQEEEL